MQLEVIIREPETRTQPTPLLFIHGAWHGAWCWGEHILPYFAQQGFVACALSLRGHGKSEGRDRIRWISVADYVADVAQVANQLDAPPVLVGHSLGGYVVQKYLETRQAPAAVLVASIPHYGIIKWLLRFSVRHPLAVFKVKLTLSPYHFIGTPSLCREALFSADMPKEKVDGYFARMQAESFRVALEALGLSLPRPGRVKTPLLVLGAANDTIFPPHEVEATARAYRAPLEIIPNIAHDVMLEENWQTVAGRIITWLKEQNL